MALDRNRTAGMTPTTVSDCYSRSNSQGAVAFLHSQGRHTKSLATRAPNDRSRLKSARVPQQVPTPAHTCTTSRTPAAATACCQHHTTATFLQARAAGWQHAHHPTSSTHRPLVHTKAPTQHRHSSRREQRIHACILVQQVPGVLRPQCSIPLQHKRRHPDRIPSLHRVPAVAQPVQADKSAGRVQPREGPSVRGRAS